MASATQIELFLGPLLDPTTGSLCAGYTAYFYAAGTSTPKNVWTEPSMENPFTSYQLDSGGKALLYGSGLYLIEVENLDGTVVLSLSTVAAGFALSDEVNHHNYVSNGDFRVQRTSTSVALTTSFVCATADGWYVIQNSSAAGKSTVVDCTYPGFPKALKIGRDAASELTNAIVAQQALLSIDSKTLAGKDVSFSFVAKGGADFSGDSVNAVLMIGRGEDESVTLMGSWTGITTPIGDDTTITGSYAQYSYNGTIPADATQIGVRFYYTPVGTAGADDNLYITSIQINEGIVGASFEKRPYVYEAELVRTPSFNSGRLSNYGPSDPFSMVHYVPLNGNLFNINNRIEVIPFGLLSSSGGVQATYSDCYIDGVANQTMVTSTLYHAYLAMLNGVMILDFSETGWSIDERNGTHVKTGDATRAYVGIVYPQAVEGTLVTYGGARGQTVCSLFNRFDWGPATEINDETTAVIPTALDNGDALENGQYTYNRVEWVQMYDSVAKIHFHANVGHTTSGSLVTLGVGLNSDSSIRGVPAQATVHSTNVADANLASTVYPAEGLGYYYAQMIGYSNTSGTTSFNGVLFVNLLVP